jgi:hypothetical protein
VPSNAPEPAESGVEFRLDPTGRPLSVPEWLVNVLGAGDPVGFTSRYVVPLPSSPIAPGGEIEGPEARLMLPPVLLEEPEIREWSRHAFRSDVTGDAWLVRADGGEAVIRARRLGHYRTGRAAIGGRLAQQVSIGVFADCKRFFDRRRGLPAKTRAVVVADMRAVLSESRGTSMKTVMEFRETWTPLPPSRGAEEDVAEAGEALARY